MGTKKNNVYIDAGLIVLSLLTAIYSIYTLTFKINLFDFSQVFIIHLFLLVYSIYVLITTFIGMKNVKYEEVNHTKDKIGNYTFMAIMITMLSLTIFSNFGIIEGKIALNLTFILSILIYSLFLLFFNLKK